MNQITLVCFAVREEAKAFKRSVEANPAIEIVITGMGRVNAQKAITNALGRIRPQAVVTAGFAGGLDPELSRGTVLFDADKTTDVFNSLRKAGARPARFHCAEQVVSTAQQKQRLRSSTGADAVEMESQAIRDLCRENQIPSATVRVILDTASEDLALDFNRVLTADMRIDPVRMALHLLGAPWKIPALVRLQKQSAAAAAVLGDVLQRALTSF